MTVHDVHDCSSFEIILSSHFSSHLVLAYQYSASFTPIQSNIMVMLATPSTSTPSDSSRTITINEHDDKVADDEVATVGVLRLRGGPRRNRRHVVWDDDVVDNEGCDRKKSKSELKVPISRLIAGLTGGLACQFAASIINRGDSTSHLTRIPLAKTRIHRARQKLIAGNLMHMKKCLHRKKIEGRRRQLELVTGSPGVPYM
jgi:Protein phosphatase inhibitor